MYFQPSVDLTVLRIVRGGYGRIRRETWFSLRYVFKERGGGGSENASLSQWCLSWAEQVGVQTLNVNRTILSASQMLRADCEDGLQLYYDCVIFGGEKAFFLPIFSLWYSTTSQEGARAGDMQITVHINKKWNWPASAFFLKHWEAGEHFAVNIL